MSVTMGEWPQGTLRSPVTGHHLDLRGSLLVADDEVWPVVDGIPFLRADRRQLAAQAVALIETGDIDAATALLLTDQDGYAPDPPPGVEQCLALVCDRESFTFRDAMRQFAFGRVADYFAHRWTDPTYFSGLALAALTGTGPVLELACGAGHFLRAFERSGVAVTGADLVFAKLWLARHFVCPEARLVCFDAASPWPLGASSVDRVFCHDAFYFLPNKAAVTGQMREVLARGGRIAIGHAHNAATDNHSAGEPLSVEGYAALLPGACLFDDLELSHAFSEGRAPVAAGANALTKAVAISLVWPHPVPTPSHPLAPGIRLRLNPLYKHDGVTARITWPSRRYEQEYAAIVPYPLQWDGPDSIEADGSDAVAALVRQGIYVDLPPRW